MAELWSKEELRDLRKMYKNTPTDEIADELGRSERAVAVKAQRLGLRKKRSFRK